MPVPVPAAASVRPDDRRLIGCVEPVASHPQPGPLDQDRPGRSAAPERGGGEEPVGEAPCDLGEERQRQGGACLRPVLVAPLPVLLRGERSLPWRRRRRRRRLCVQRELRRMGDGRGGVDRVQVHGQPLRAAQPGGAVRRPLVLPQPSLDRGQRRQPAIAATSLAPVKMLRWRERAIMIERPALEQQVRAAADVRLQRARPLDPAKAPAQRPVRSPQRALDTHRDRRPDAPRRRSLCPR